MPIGHGTPPFTPELYHRGISPRFQSYVLDGISVKGRKDLFRGVQPLEVYPKRDGNRNKSALPILVRNLYFSERVIWEIHTKSPTKIDIIPCDPSLFRTFLYFSCKWAGPHGGASPPKPLGVSGEGHPSLPILQDEGLSLRRKGLILPSKRTMIRL